MERILEAITRSELVQIDSRRDVVFETPSADVLNTISQYFEDPVRRCEDSRAKPSSPVSDSDSGDSLFLTQAETPVLRAVKRHRSSERPALLLHSELDDENVAVRNEGVTRLRKPRRSHVRPNRTVFPFLLNCRKFRLGRLPVRKNQVLVNSEIGGFFKCVQKISQGHKVQRRELVVSSSVQEEECVEEGGNDDGIRVVDAECFIFDANKRNRQPWLPKSRWTMRLNKGKKEDKNKQKQKSQKQKPKEKGKTEEQPESMTSRSNKLLQCKSRTEKKKSVSTVSRTSVSSLECSSTRHLLLDQEEHSEKQPEVLATCSQSVVHVVEQHDHSRTHSAHQLAEMCAENVNGERMVEETQMPDSDQTLVEPEETPVLEMVEHRSKESGEDGIYMDNLPFGEPQESDKDPGEDGHHEMQDHEDCGDSIGSVDLFGQEGNQIDELIDASSLIDEIRVRDRDEDQESCVVQCDERSPVRKENSVAKQADMAIETDSPLFNYGGLTFLKRRKRKTSETSEVSHSLLSGAGYYNRSSTYNDACGQKKKKMSSPLDEDTHALSLSEANSTGGAKECQTDENSVQSLSHSSDETCIEEDLVPVAAAVTEPEPRPATGLSTPIKDGEGGQQDDGMPEENRVQLEGVEPLTMESSLCVAAQKLVEKTTQEGFLEDNAVERQERRDIPSTTGTQSNNAMEPFNSCDAEANRENQRLCKDVQSDDLVTPKKNKPKKKKRLEVVNKSLDLLTDCGADCDEQQVTELVPEKQQTKKKRKREHDVEENVKTIGASYVENTKQGEEKILKKKKKKVGIKAYHIEDAEKTVEVVQDFEKQTTELVRENKMKKKKKNKSKQVVGNNIGVEATEQVETLQVEDKFKKKKKEYVENKVGVKASQVEAAEQTVEALEDSVKQTTESVPEKKLKKKKKKGQVIENNVGVEAWQVKAAELVAEVHKDSEKQTTESASEKKIKKKKKKEQVVENNVGVETTETVEALEDIQTVEVLEDSVKKTTESVPVKNVKKKKKKHSENSIGEEAWQVKASEQAVEVHKHTNEQITESVPVKKSKKKNKKEQIVENNVGVQATEAVEALEVVQYYLQTTESVPENKMKKKKKKNKREQVVENNVGDEACPVEAAEKTVDIFQDSEKQTTESVPEKKLKKKKKKKKEQVVENNMGVEACQVEAAEQVGEAMEDSVNRTTESVPEKNLKKKKKKKEQVVKNNVGVKPAEAVEALEEVQYYHQTTESVPENKMKKKRNKREQVVENIVSDEDCPVETAEKTVVPEKKLKKKKKKKERLVENNVGDEACPVELAEQIRALEVVQHHEQKPTESVPEKKLKKKKKKEQIVEKNVGVKSTAAEKTVEVVQDSEKQTTESVPEKKLKRKRERLVENDLGEEVTESVPEKKRKRKKERLVENDLGDDVTESVPEKKRKRKKERLVENDLGDDVTESVPEKKMKKKKKKGEQVVEKATEQVEALELIPPHQQQATEFNPEIKVMKKKKKKKREHFDEDNIGAEACPVESTDQCEAFEIVEHYQHQAAGSDPEKRLNKKKKKKKNKSFDVFQENMAVDFCEVIQDCVQETAELVPKKKQKKTKKKNNQDVVETVDVEATQFATAEHVEALQLVQETEQQCPELVSEIKVNKKIKKKKNTADSVEGHVAVQATSSSKQVDALQLTHDFEQESVQLVPEKSKRKKLKKLKKR